MIFNKAKRFLLTTILLALGVSIVSAQSEKSNYRLKAGDSIAMLLFQEPDMTTESRITSEGTVHFPLIGKLAVAGKTLPELQNDLRRLYDADYFVNPQVSIQITEYAPLRVKVRGRVNRPGFIVIPPEESFTIMDAIAAAGDIAPNGNEKKVELHRVGANGKLYVSIIDLSANNTATNGPAATIVQENDAIIVPEKLF